MRSVNCLFLAAFEKAGTPAHTAYLQSVRKNGVDPLALFEATAKSEAMKVGSLLFQSISPSRVLGILKDVRCGITI